MQLSKQQISDSVKELAEKMPLVMEWTHEVHMVKGQELIDQGQDVTDDGKKIKPERTYLQNMPVQIAINHERRMRKAYKKNGYAGLQEYITKMLSLVKEQV